MAKRLTPEQRKERDDAEQAEKLRRSNARKEATAKREKEKAEKREKEKNDRKAERDKRRKEREDEERKGREEAAAKKAKAKAEAEEARVQREAEEKANRERGRKDNRAARFAEIEKRHEQTKSEGRRPKATHFSYTGEGLSKPQALSVRGQVLALIVENCEPGLKFSIDDFGDLAEPILFGTNVRSYLAKLEEMKHIDFHTL